MSVADRSWMYNGWNDNGCHSQDWVHNTNAFLDHAFSAIPNAENRGVVCPCSDCCNRVKRRRATKCLVCPRCSSLHCFHLLLFCIILYFANSHNKFLYGQETYKATVIELNGPEFDWIHSPLDVRALYQCSCGRQHGKWATFNGTVNDSEVLPQLKGSHASAMAARRQC